MDEMMTALNTLPTSSNIDVAKQNADKRPQNDKERKLKKASADFESLVYFYMLKAMRNTVPKNGLLGKSAGADTFTMMLDQQIASDMAKAHGGQGLQKVIFNQLMGASQGKPENNLK